MAFSFLYLAFRALKGAKTVSRHGDAWDPGSRQTPRMIGPFAYRAFLAVLKLLVRNAGPTTKDVEIMLLRLWGA
jgi:hypothetical protein